MVDRRIYLSADRDQQDAILRGVITSRPGEIPVPATFALLGLGVVSLGAVMAGRRRS